MIWTECRILLVIRITLPYSGTEVDEEEIHNDSVF